MNEAQLGKELSRPLAALQRDLEDVLSHYSSISPDDRIALLLHNANFLIASVAETRGGGLTSADFAAIANIFSVEFAALSRLFGGLQTTGEVH